MTIEYVKVSAQSLESLFHEIELRLNDKNEKWNIVDAKPSQYWDRYSVRYSVWMSLETSDG